MGTKDIVVKGYSSSAELRSNFSVIQCLLQDDQRWAARVLEGAGETEKVSDRVGLFNTVYTSRIIPQSPDTFIALGPIGITERLCYQIKQVDEETITITPIPFLEQESKIGLLLILAFFFLLPALLSPLIWKKIESRNLLLSKFYLLSFCNFLFESF